MAQDATSRTPGDAPASPPARLESLDALRGFDMFWIMGADAIGGAFLKMGTPLAAEAGPAAAPASGALVRAAHFLGEQLEHVEWEGFRFYDLIFPLFVFMAGVSLVLSLSRTVAQEGRGVATGRLLRRALLLYLVGIFYYGGIGKGWDQVRLLGVLQRIALAYLGAGLCFLHLKPRGLVTALAVILLGYWGLMALVPVPGIGAGHYAEGRNLANWIDAQYLPLRKWDGDHDPEGLLSTLPAIGSCLLGVLAGIHLRTGRGTGVRRAATLVGVGLALVAAGHLWGVWFPVIKKLWTSSYVLVAGGWSAVLLGVFHYGVDIRGWRGWCRPFVWIGLNPIAIYLLTNLVNFDALSRRFVGGEVVTFLDGVFPGLALLALALLGIGWGVWVAWYLDRRRVYLRL
ncbi:MAG: acyltransferase family protein [Verrucomicrobiota bacterium]